LKIKKKNSYLKTWKETNPHEAMNWWSGLDDNVLPTMKPLALVYLQIPAGQIFQNYNLKKIC